ncbi:MAG: DUF4097 family beta strand repeat-containing protein [Cyclobacteriaceae bacterium]
MKLLILLLAITNPDLKEDRIQISKSYEIESPENFTVLIDNIFGDIEVESSNDNKVYLELEIAISGHTDALVEKAKRELELGERHVDDSLILYTEAPFIKRCRWGNGGIGYNTSRDPQYKFRYQYKLRVPKNSGVYARTVNQGDVLIKNIDGVIRANNVNGDVDIENARDVRAASTVNGDVTINFLENPKESVDFNTVNGDFNFELPKNLNAKIYFDSMNGDMYSAFDYKKLSPKIEKSSKNGKFKIGTKTGVEIGAGGPELSFRSINGNVYLKRSKAQ